MKRPNTLFFGRRRIAGVLSSALWILSIVAQALWSPAFAQVGGYSGASFRIGFDPVGMAMGNSVAAWAESGSASFYNPAFAAIPDPSIALQVHSSLLSFDRKLNTFSGRIPLPPSAGLSVSLLHMGVKGIDGRTQSGYPTGELGTYDLQAATAFGIRFSERFWAGVALKWSVSHLHENVPNASTLSIDVGTRMGVSDRLTLAVVVQDLLGSYSWDTSGLYGSEQSFSDEQPFPVRTRLAAHLMPWDRWDLTSEIELRRQQIESDAYRLVTDVGEPRMIRDTESSTDRSLLLRQGVAFRPIPAVAFRFGLESDDIRYEARIRWSTGFSVDLGRLPGTPRFDYAFAEDPGLRSMNHAFSLSFDL